MITTVTLFRLLSLRVTLKKKPEALHVNVLLTQISDPKLNREYTEISLTISTYIYKTPFFFNVVF